MVAPGPRGLGSEVAAATLMKTQVPGGKAAIGVMTLEHSGWFGDLSSGGGGLVAQSCPILATPWTAARQAPLSMGFSRQEYWSGLPFPSPGDPSNPGIELGSPAFCLLVNP